MHGGTFQQCDCLRGLFVSVRHTGLINQKQIPTEHDSTLEILSWFVAPYSPSKACSTTIKLFAVSHYAVLLIWVPLACTIPNMECVNAAHGWGVWVYCMCAFVCGCACHCIHVCMCVCMCVAKTCAICSWHTFWPYSVFLNRISVKWICICVQTRSWGRLCSEISKASFVNKHSDVSWQVGPQGNLNWAFC